ncbi:MAG: hypothetical protein AAGH40_12660 [Verrucomicrobiota bacterium]
MNLPDGLGNASEQAIAKHTGHSQKLTQPLFVCEDAEHLRHPN